MDGALGAESIFMRNLTLNSKHVRRWLYIWAPMESGLMAVNRVGRHVESWIYIQGSTCNDANEEKTINHWWMLYVVNAALGVCLCLRYVVLHGYYNQCQLMFIPWTDQEALLNPGFCNDGSIVDEQARDRGWRWEQYKGYEQIRWISSMRCLIE